MGLFVDEATLKARLRLARLPDASGANELLAEATLQVRLELLEELGETRVAEINAIAFTETPTTANERLRAEAHAIEVKWTRLELSKSLPMLFADGNQDNGQIFHDEAVFRQPSADQLETLRSQLWDEIQLSLMRLRGSSDAQDRNRVRFSAITPDDTPPVPGETLDDRFYRRS